jgi:hypothetical protein
MCKVLGIPSPKGDIDGSQVGHVFYVDKDIDRIVTYCEKDHCRCSDFLRLREDLLIDERLFMFNKRLWDIYKWKSKRLLQLS